MVTRAQTSFAGGVLSPSLHARRDLAKFDVGLKSATNVFVHAQGGASNRAGLKFVIETKDSTKTARLLPFAFNTTQTYVLEFGDQALRIIKQDGIVLESAKTITGITKANPGVVTSAAHGYANGDLVYISGVVGMTEVNGKFYTVANKATNTFELSGTDTSGYTAYSSGGAVAKVYEVATPYAHTELAGIKFVQSADVIYLVHPNHKPRKLTRTAHNAWTLTEVTFAPSQDHPTGVSVTVNTTGTETDRYQVTAVKEETLEESLPGIGATATISGATQANPVVITANSHGFANGDEVDIFDVGGMAEINDRRFKIANVATNTFELEGEDGTGHTAYTSGGTVGQTFRQVTNSNTTRDNTVSWTAPAGDVEKYNVYRRKNGLYGFIGSTEETSFEDDNIDPDVSDTPPKSRQPFLTSGNYPSAVGLHQQRSVWGATNNDPQKTWMSQSADFQNLNVSTPSKDDDAVTFTIAAQQVNEIRHFISLRDLLVLTSGGEWRVTGGGEDNAITPSNVKVRPQSYEGGAAAPPIVSGNVVLYAQEKGRQIRDLAYQLEVDGYADNDLSVLAEHLFETRSIKEWAFSKQPYRVVWIVMSDGKMLSLTYHREHEVFAFSEHETKGTIESVAVIAEGSQDVPYFVVKRTINGTDFRYIERMDDREFPDVRDAFFVDSGLTNDDPKTITGATKADPVVVTAAAHGFSNQDTVDIVDVAGMTELNEKRFLIADKTDDTMALVDTARQATISDPGATQANPVVVTATSHGLSNGDVIAIYDVVGMTELNGKTYTVAGKTDDTFELSGVDGTGYTAYSAGGVIHHAIDGSGHTAYDSAGEVREAVLTLSGLDHIEGESVAILADGNVVTSKAVSGGSVTLDNRASRIHIGIPYTARIETLPLNLALPQPLQNHKKTISKVVCAVKDSRGIFVGHEADNLAEWKQRSTEKYDAPIALFTGSVEIRTPPVWDMDQTLFVEQPNPLPMTILSLAPEVNLGG